MFTFLEHTDIKNLDRMLATIFRVPETSMLLVDPYTIANKIQNTYTTFPKLFGIYWRRKIKTPRVIGHWILPVYKAFRCLSNPRSCKKKKNTFSEILTVSKWSIFCVSGSLFGYVMCLCMLCVCQYKSTSLSSQLSVPSTRMIQKKKYHRLCGKFKKKWAEMSNKHG